MSEERTYYKMTPGGAAEKAFNEWCSQLEEAKNSWFAFAQEFGVEQVFADNRLRGLMFDSGDAPEGWASTAKLPTGAYKPQRRKVCMEAYDAFKALPSKPSNIVFAKLLKVDAVFKSSCMHLPGIVAVGDEYLLSLHVESEVPEGVEPLKMSEFWAMKEATA